MIKNIQKMFKQYKKKSNIVKKNLKKRYKMLKKITKIVKKFTKNEKTNFQKM